MVMLGQRITPTGIGKFLGAWLIGYILEKAAEYLMGFFSVAPSTPFVLELLLGLAIGLVLLGVIGLLWPSQETARIAPPRTDEETTRLIEAGRQHLWQKQEAEITAQVFRDKIAELKAERAKALERAPHLTWSGVSVVPYQQGYEVRVVCSNVGSTTALVKEQTRVDSIASQARLIGPKDAAGRTVIVPAAEIREQIAFFDFSVPGDIKPVGQYSPFTLRMRCPKRAPLLDRTVTWRIVYKDDDDKLGFVSECSAIIDLALGNLSVGSVVLDQSSREARNDKYNEMVKRGAL